MAPRVPFARAREESGFDLPEIRMTPAASQWLESPRPNGFCQTTRRRPRLSKEFVLQLDRPLDNAVAGWSAPRRVLPLSGQAEK